MVGPIVGRSLMPPPASRVFERHVVGEPTDGPPTPRGSGSAARRRATTGAGCDGDGAVVVGELDVVMDLCGCLAEEAVGRGRDAVRVGQLSDAQVTRGGIRVRAELGAVRLGSDLDGLPIGLAR